MPHTAVSCSLRVLQDREAASDPSIELVGIGTDQFFPRSSQKLEYHS